MRAFAWVAADGKARIEAVKGRDRLVDAIDKGEDGRSLDDVLRDSTGSADFQKKMAKAMRVRAERHEHALTLLKHEHAAQIAKMQEKARELEEAVQRQHKEEMEAAMERANERMERYVRCLVRDSEESR